MLPAPLLRNGGTALVFGYKHVTPSGVKNLAFSQANQRLQFEMMADFDPLLFHKFLVLPTIRVSNNGVPRLGTKLSCSEQLVSPSAYYFVSTCAESLRVSIGVKRE